MVRRAVLLLVLIAAGASATAASAQSTASLQTDSPDYREFVNQGTQEYDLGNYAEARSLFERAHAIQPNARTLRALGLAEFELRNYQASVKHLQDALASDAKPLTGDMRRSAEELLRRARAFVGQVQLETEPTGATVLLDGQPLDDRSDALWLTVGDHVFEFQAIGYATQRRTLRIVGGEKQTLRVVLTALEAAPSGGLSLATSERQPNQPLYKKWWLWTSVGVVVVASAAVASYFLLKPAPETHYGFKETPNTPTGYGIELPPARVP